MSETTQPNHPTPAEPPKRRMLVEDADAIVEVVGGRERVTKVPDRAAEAAKRGVDEAQL